MGWNLRQSAPMKKNMNLTSILATNLTRLMDETVGMDTVEKVSSRSTVSRGTVDRVKKGEVATKIETVQLLANAFGLTPVQLLSENLGRGSGSASGEAPTSDDPFLQWTNRREAGLLSAYRNADDEGKDTIEKIARMVKPKPH